MTDFKSLNSRLQPYWESILITNAPGGKVVGNEYKASGINGGSGRSFSFNLVSGKWADFATGDKGNDVISYYALVKSVSQGEAAKELTTVYVDSKPMHAYPVKLESPQPKIIKPPDNAGKPNHPSFKDLEPTNIWTYKDVDSKPLFYIYRQDPPNDKKQIRPLCYSDNAKWVQKHWPVPRPLYNLDKIYADKTKPILVVEGEKSAEAAQILCKKYTVTTWPAGSNNVSQVDLTPLEGRKVLLWPDADKPGLEAMDFIIGKISQSAEEVKIIYPDRNSGWDAADAVAEGWDYERFSTWAKPLVKKIEPYKQVFASEILDAEIKPIKESKPDGDLEANIDSKMRSMYVELGLDMDQNKTKLLQTSINVERVLLRHPYFKGNVWYDEFYDRSFIKLNGTVKAVEDSTYLELFSLFQDKFKFLKLSKTTCDLGLDQAALKDKRNEPQTWLNSLVWDGVSRIEEFFIRAYGTEDNEYTRKVSQNFFVAQAARVLTPGCKFDNMVILEGLQGTGKSNSLKALIGDKWFVEAQSTMDSKDFEIGLLGKIIVEFGELDQFRKAETTLIKKKLSCSIDSFRPVHGKKNKDYPRTCIFVGTTNKDDYLQDETGARRFWPISTGKIDIDYITANKDQLYAEAVVKFKDGFEYYSVPETAKDEQELRRYVHPWEDIIKNYFNSGIGLTTYHITVADIWHTILGGEVIRLEHKNSIAIGKIMKAIGWTYKPLKTNGSVKKEWVRPGYNWQEEHLKKSNTIQQNLAVPNYALINRRSETNEQI